MPAPMIRMPLAAEAQRAVKDASGLSCSVGIGDNRLRAKLATGFAKPAGGYRLTRDNWMAVMAGRPTDALWGIGARTARKLAAAGITTVGQLARADPADLAGRFGPTMGPWYRAVALGAGGTEVSAEPYVARSRSRETTFQRDIVERAELDEQLVVLARRVAQDVAAEGRPAVRVGVKVRFAPFFTQTRSLTLPAPNDQRRGHHGVGADAAGPVRTGPPGAAAGSAGRIRPGEVNAGVSRRRPPSGWGRGCPVRPRRRARRASGRRRRGTGRRALPGRA